MSIYPYSIYIREYSDHIREYSDHIKLLFLKILRNVFCSISGGNSNVIVKGVFQLLCRETIV